MTYSYDPHKHIKIWLSKDPAVFMNFENQMRLLEMRWQNPDDKITLIYDSRLLNNDSTDELHKFCAENDVVPVDAGSFDQTLLSENETKLYKYYEEEIFNLNKGGNLAVASDILRWLPPVFKHGTYTDFDFPVNTSSLGKTITTQSPLLLNIGSLKLGSQELIISNNDYIAVVDPENAQGYIQKVQQGILNSLDCFDSDFIKNASDKLGGTGFLNRRISTYMKTRAESEYIEKSERLNAIRNPRLSSRQLRELICQITNDQSEFLNLYRESNENDNVVIQKLRKNLSSQLSIIKWFFFNKDYREIKNILKQNDDKFLQLLMTKERSLYIKSIVICTTGPIRIAKSLFGEYVLSSNDFNQQALPISFNHYGLNKAFQSPNSIPLHESPVGMLRFLGAADGQLNDSSWLEEGIKLQESRQSILQKEQSQLKTRLPSELQAAKDDVTKNLAKLHRQSNSIWTLWGLLFKSRRKAKIEALEAVLKCFKNTNNFNAKDFHDVLLSIHLKRKDVYAGLFFSHTREVIEKLEKTCHDAVVFQLTEDGETINYSNNYSSKGSAPCS